MKPLGFCILLWAGFVSASEHRAAKTSALVVPADANAESHTLHVEDLINEALAQRGGIQVVAGNELLHLSESAAAKLALQRAEKLSLEGTAAYQAHLLVDAEAKFKLALESYELAPAAMKYCEHYCDALALYAASIQHRGALEETKTALLNLLALNPTHEFKTDEFDKEFLAMRTKVATSSQASSQGEVKLESKPPGARVYFDGEMRGYSPVTLQGVVYGKHLFRLEKPGFQMAGQWLQVDSPEIRSSLAMASLPLYEKYRAHFQSLRSELSSGKSNAQAFEIGRLFNLDHLVLGQVRQTPESSTFEIEAGWYDVKNGRRLASRKAVFQGDEFGQLKSEVSHFVALLLHSNDRNEDVNTHSSDPLQRKAGTEDWDGEKGKRKAKGSLNDKSGMEDW